MIAPAEVDCRLALLTHGETGLAGGNAADAGTDRMAAEVELARWAPSTAFWTGGYTLATLLWGERHLVHS